MTASISRRFFNANADLTNPAQRAKWMQDLSLMLDDIVGALNDPLMASPVFTKYFESAEQTITSAGALTLAHGLGVKPKLIQVALVCKTAEAGYSINDELFVTIEDDDGINKQGTGIVVDTANLNIRFSSGGNVYVVLNKTTGGRAAITNSNWKAIFRAWA